MQELHHKHPAVEDILKSFTTVKVAIQQCKSTVLSAKSIKENLFCRKLDLQLTYY